MLAIEITTKIGCRNKCIYCPQDKLKKAYSKRSNILQMSFEVFKQCVNKIPKRVIIDFGGMCEPWLNPEASKMALYARLKGHRIRIFTTLVGMKLEDIDLIEAIRPIEFALHLPSQGGYEKIIVNKYYLNLVKKLFKAKINIMSVILGNGLHPKLKLLLNRKELYRRIFPHTRALNIKIGSRPNPKRLRGIIGCQNNISHNVLLPNGDVTLCCMDYGMKHVLGNLLSSNYSSLFRSKGFLMVKKGLRNESMDILCRYCEEFTYSEQ